MRSGNILSCRLQSGGFLVICQFTLGVYLPALHIDRCLPLSAVFDGLCLPIDKTPENQQELIKHP